jgi:hypothetical protein
MTEMENSFTDLFRKSHIRRKRGTARHRLKDNIKMDFKPLGFTKGSLLTSGSGYGLRKPLVKKQ